MECIEMKRKIVFGIGNLLLIIAICFVGAALLGEKKTGEAYIGDFGTKPFNENWNVKWDSNEQVLSLPAYLEDCKDTTVIMENTLPDDISDGMRLCMRSALQEISFYIDGELRGEYVNDDMPYVGENLPSSYIVVDLNETDAGKTICIEVLVNERNKLNEITIGYGNNAWFSLLSDNIPVVVAAIILVFVGIFAIAFYFLLRKRLHLTGAICYLGQIMIIVGLWILSESHLRQLIFRNPSYSSVFAYLLLEILGGFVAMYFDEVQKHKYEKIYSIVEIMVFGQVVVNILLAVSGVADFYSTILYSHIWLVVGFIVVVFTMITDIKTGRFREYLFTALGMAAFLALCFFELLVYYLKDFHILGNYLCIGLILLLCSTIVQAVKEEFERIRVTVEREKFQAELEQKVDEQTLELRIQQERISELFVETVIALCEAVDAKDRYTSGHSKRVGKYARMIAARMGKSEEEQEEIYRAGLLHDVGKIRVPAEIINKAGKLTDEEYNVIKIHPVTGYHILRGIAGNSDIAIAAKYHHERYDGKGYPNGLAGENIPQMARILGVADSYDAMASDRSYRKALPQEIVRQEIEKGKGTQFDPQIADIMIAMIDEDTQYQLKQPKIEMKRILTITDAKTNYIIIQDIMSDEPMYEIVLAENMQSAQVVLEQKNCDLILLDVDTSQLGEEYDLTQLKEKYQIPIVIMTDEISQELTLRFRNVGCDDFLTKKELSLMLKEVVHTMTERGNY